MWKTVGLVAAGLALTAQMAVAGQADQRKDFQVAKDIAASVRGYSQFTIFDEVTGNVHDGVVSLTGKVTMPYKRDDIGRRVAKVDGVRQVENKLEVLPVSPSDDALRYRIALDASMNAGEGGLSATAVTPEPLVQLGRAELPFTVVK